MYSIVSYLYVSCSGSVTEVGEAGANFSAIVTCNYVDNVRRTFCFPLVLGTGCNILSWHSLGLPYYYLSVTMDRESYRIGTVGINRIHVCTLLYLWTFLTCNVSNGSIMFALVSKRGRFYFCTGKRTRKSLFFTDPGKVRCKKAVAMQLGLEVNRTCLTC